MSSGKKKGSKQGKKTLSLNEFLGNEKAPNFVKSSVTSWADEMEAEDAEPDQTSLIDRSALPTAPRAARDANVDMDKVPTAPPFTAFLGNLPFEVSVEDIEQFFQALQVTNVRLIEEGGRAKGYGYAQFADRQSLVEALSMDETTMRGRPVRVNLAEGKQGDRDDRGPRKYDDFEDPDDWRKKPAGSQQDDFSSSRDSGRGFGSDRDGRYGDRDSGRNDDRGGSTRVLECDDGSSWRRGGGGSRDSTDRNDGPRDRDGGGGRSFGSGYRDEKRRYSPPRDRYASRDEGYGRRDRDGPDRRDDARDADPSKERPKLQLQKRSKPAEKSQEPESRSSSIFGSAKPVDTLSKELAIEQKLQSKPHEPAPFKPAPREPAPEARGRSSIFGSAKPVDTAAREREMEARMREKRQPSHSERRPEITGYRTLDDDRERSKPRRDSASPESRPERLSSSSKGASRVKRDSVREDEEEPTTEERPAPKSPMSPTAPKDESKLVPAPPPKENVWAKRKEQQTSPPSTQATPASPPSSAAVPQTEDKEDSKECDAQADRPPKADAQADRPAKADAPADRPPKADAPADRPPKADAPADRPPKADAPADTPREADTENTAPGGPPIKTEFIPAKAPVENVWAKRAQMKKVEEPTPPVNAASDNVSQGRTEPRDVGRTEARDVGRSEVRDSGRPNAWTRGAPRGGGRGGGTPRGRGGYRGDPPKKHREEKPLPKSIDEMPKYQDKQVKDISDANKFSLLVDEDGGKSDGED